MHRTILGIEGTAWNLSAGVVTETDVLAEATVTYQPKTDGIHPREAAQHHATHIASVIRKAIKSAGDVEIDGIAFSQGPGMDRARGRLQQQPAHWHSRSMCP